MQTNTLHCGDNLKIMQQMPDASIDLICTDPPFCSQRDYGAFNDKWDDGLNGYLKFMRPRIEQMHRLLKDTGSLYLHCDPSASHYLKVMLDEVFGRKNFRNEIVWSYTGRQIAGAPHNHFYNAHDIVLLFIKTNKAVFHPQFMGLTERMIEERERGYHSQGKSLCVLDANKPAAQARIKSGNYETIRYMKEPNKGKSVSDMWFTNPLTSTANERNGYPTQKPETLYQRMIQASSNEGDLVLDPFCGSGTTCVAANNLGRYYIGIDQNPDAIEIAESRLAQLNLFTAAQ